MREEEAMQITRILQPPFLSELKIFFSLLLPLMRTERSQVSRSSSHAHSRLALQALNFRGGSGGMFSWCSLDEARRSLWSG